MNPTSANPNFPTFVVYVEWGSICLPLRPIGDPSCGIMHKWSQVIVFRTVGRIHGSAILYTIICTLSLAIYARSFLRFMTSLYRVAAKCLEIHEPWYVAYVLACAAVLNTTLCRISCSLWLGA